MRRTIMWVFMIFGTTILSGCSLFWRPQSVFRQYGTPLDGPANAENGELIYFRAVSARGTAITYSGGSNFGGMMMGNNLTCAACHGPNARGGLHTMHMQVMEAPEITWTALSAEVEEHGEDDHGDDHGGEYSLKDFRRAVVEGEHPDGEPLSREMPRWQMNEDDLVDLLAFLESIE